MTDRKLLVEFRRLRNVESFGRIVAEYLPLVTRVADAHFEAEGKAALAAEITFQVLGRRFRRLSRRTYLPGWLVRTTIYAVLRMDARKESAPSEPNPLVQGTHNHGLWLRALVELSPKYSDVLVAVALNEGDLERAASQLSCSRRRVAKRLRRGQGKLAKRACKRGLSANSEGLDSALFFLSESLPKSSNLNPLVLAERSLKRGRLSSLTRLTIKSWSWLYWKRRLKLGASAVACCLLLVASLVLGMIWAWETGYLMSWLLPWGSRLVLKEAPALALPPRDWTGEGMYVNALRRGRADLFQLTNVWQMHLTFSPEQWKGLEPKRVRPMKLIGSDGTINLRNPNAKRSGLAGVLGIEFEWTQADLEFGGETFPQIAARYRGNGTYISSLYGSKQSFKVDLNKFREDQKLEGLDKINFNNMVEDATYMHDALGYAFFRSAGVAAPRTAYAWMTVSVTGQEEASPRGLYLMLENVDQHFAKDRFGTKKTPIFKPVTPYLFRYLGPDWVAYEAIYDLKTTATDAQKQRVIDFADCLTHDGDETFARRVSGFLDLDQFARFLAGMVLIASYDGFLTNGQNFYMYLDVKTDQFCFIPWDLDHAWGDFPFVGTPSARDQASIWHPWAGEHRLLERVIQLEAFRELYREQLESLLASEFRLEALGAQIDTIASVIDDVVQHDSAFRYRRFVKAVGDQWGAPPPRGEGPVRPVNNIKRFIEARAASVRAQLDGESEGMILSQE
ncbi:MAG: Inner spore coat protein H [Verrucomicrobia subdivision 3 bacterium]|nr:Inner spore coat protein H [Limisphaerales bacterium]MCS1414712.1 Inner spore coat protein H [Limisphaerales bacterium]